MLVFLMLNYINLHCIKMLCLPKGRVQMLCNLAATRGCLSKPLTKLILTQIQMKLKITGTFFSVENIFGKWHRAEKSVTWKCFPEHSSSWSHHKHPLPLPYHFENISSVTCKGL